MPSEFFSRDEVLGGLPSRRASTVLFSIEAHAAHLNARSQRAMARFPTRQSVEMEEFAFLESMRQGRDLPAKPSIQVLERFAPEYTALVPEDSGLRAALAHLIGEKYKFRRGDVPQLRAALGLDTPPVLTAYARLYGKPLETTYSMRISLPEQMRWWVYSLTSRLEQLPPFTTAYALTLTETVGASILALPIALAEVGPLAGIAFLLILGLVNIITIIGISEATIRNGKSRYWAGGFLSELAGSYLGSGGSIIFSIGLVILIFVLLLSFYMGVATTLGQITRIPEEYWALALFLVNLYFVRRQTLNATITSALVIGAINIAVILLLSLLVIPHVRLDNLMFMNLPYLNGRPLEPGLLKLIFGVILLSYFGHTSTANCARVVLRRDPTGRALIQGNVAAMVTAMALYCLWTIAINGAISPDRLADPNLRGTVIPLLVQTIGPVADVLGSIYIVLGMGMLSIHFSIGMFNQVRTWMPDHIWRRALNTQSQFWLAASPIIAMFVLIEYLLVTNRGSYTGTLGFLGVLKGSLLGGIFPILMLAASRRKGEYVPGIALRILNQRAVLIAVYLLFLLGIFSHGLFIWQDTPSRLAALAVGTVSLAMPIAFIRGGFFKRRATIECRAEQLAGDHAIFNITANGKYLPTQVALKFGGTERHTCTASGEIGKFSTLTSMAVTLPKTTAQELKVWVHHINSDEASEWLPAKVQVSNVHGLVLNDLIDREVILPLDGDESTVEIQFLPSEEQMRLHHEMVG